jgi:hypothetical protein
MGTVHAAIDLAQTPDAEIRERLERIMALGWLPERAVLRKVFEGDVQQDVAEDELREAMGEFWVEARHA